MCFSLLTGGEGVVTPVTRKMLARRARPSRLQALRDDFAVLKAFFTGAQIGDDSKHRIASPSEVQACERGVGEWGETRGSL